MGFPASHLPYCIWKLDVYLLRIQRKISRLVSAYAFEVIHDSVKCCESSLEVLARNRKYTTISVNYICIDADTYRYTSEQSTTCLCIFNLSKALRP